MLTKRIMEVLTSASQSSSRTTWHSKFLLKLQMRRLLYLKHCTNPPCYSMWTVHSTLETIKLILCKCSIHQTNSFRRKPIILLISWNRSRWKLRLCLIIRFPRVHLLLDFKEIIEIHCRLPYLIRMRLLVLAKRRPISTLISWEITRRRIYKTKKSEVHLHNQLCDHSRISLRSLTEITLRLHR
jgi:hypothetical protein